MVPYKGMRVTVPGRVNLIGEHIDYHDLPVLPMAIQRRICLDYSTIEDGVVRGHSEKYGDTEVPITGELQPDANGHWSNYIKAAVETVRRRWPIQKGIEATVTSDLPPAAGLSSSSALLVGFTIALLRANGIEPKIDELMEVLPDGEQFVGTRGGGMDHAAVLTSRPGCALLIEFAPFVVQHVPIPDSWQFIVAHSLTTAEKSGAARQLFNARRQAGQSAREKSKAGLPLNEDEARALRHIETEAVRVRKAVDALKNGYSIKFGHLLCESHDSLRHDLRVSRNELDELVATAMNSGAMGARLTGAGFGGCAIVFCEKEMRERVADGLIKGFYARRKGFDRAQHLIFAEPSAGALYAD